jgi:glycosyltransferase involved in cell wall biosynthesis
MPSHREGFGMPVLEAGLVGIPVFSTPIPAAREIGDQDIILINSDDDPASVADQLLKWSEESSVHRLRRRVRQKYTWRSIFKRQIQPLLQGDESQNNPPCQ